MRTRRLRVAAFVLALALVGPWTAANADNWPDPNPAAGHGVTLADMTIHSAAGVGFRLTLKKPGEVDFLWWAGLTAAPQSDEGISDGVAVWNVRTPTSPLYYGYGDVQSASSDFYLNGDGHTILDSRATSSKQSVDEILQMFQLPAGTYDAVLWTASNARHLESRFRLQAPKGTKLVRRSASTRTFRLVQREFSGTASANATFSGPILVNESAHVAVRNTFFGAFQLPPYLVSVLTFDTIPTGSYSGPTGTHQVAGDAIFAGAPAGGYSFTVAAGAYGEPLVAGVDMTAP